MDKSQYLKPREYEMMAVLLPDQGEDETTAGIDKMLSYITDENGTIDSVNTDSPWGRRRLAYTIRHEGVDYRDGHYVLVYFTAMPSALSEIERELKLDTNVMRYLLLIHDPEMGEKFDESQLAEAEEAEAEEEATEVAETEAAPAEENATEEAETEGEEAVDVAEDAAVEEAEVEAEATVEESSEEEAAADETSADEAEESEEA